ncbi:30S ribosomal protein S17 [Bacillus licheniformis]|nr:30S ribosomal protein S17 [Bacillus licheniformis]
MDKTITVVVETYKKHSLYGKRVKYSKKFKAHDENNQAKIGDIVKIMETRPLSATKRFRLVEVVEEVLRFQLATGQLENTARIREVRKSIARMKTVIREREIAANK